MPAPTFIADYETVWNTSTSPKTTGTFNASLNDVLVGLTGDENADTGENHTVTNTQGALTWTEVVGSATVDADCFIQAASAVVDGAKTGMTVTNTRTSGQSGNWSGIDVLHWSGSDGVGASATSSTTQSVSITTTQDNSAVAVIAADWAASDWGASTRPWLTVNSLAGIETAYFRNSVHYTVGACYWSDVGAAGAKTVGLTGLTGTFVILALEVKGTAGAALLPPILVMQTRRPY